MSMLDHNASAVGMAAGALYRWAADTVLGLLSSHLESRVLSANMDLASADRASSSKIRSSINTRANSSVAVAHTTTSTTLYSSG